MPFPPEDKSFIGLLKDIQTRLNLIERALRRGGGVTVTSGAVAPVSPPSRVGEMYVRTDTNKVYIATGTTAVGDWTLMN